MGKCFSAAVLVTVVLLISVPVGGLAKERLTRRDPVLYGLSSFVLPGLGQYLNGEPDKALFHFLIAVALPIMCYYALPYHPVSATVCPMLSLGWHVYSGIDAYEMAQRFNEAHGFAIYLHGSHIGFKCGFQI
ncbi:MAG: hypothetical protein ACUVQS_07110 [Candidatus Bipolaricaulaceae bacterium]